MSGISGNRHLEALKEFREHAWARFYAAFATKGKGGKGNDGMRQALSTAPWTCTSPSGLSLTHRLHMMTL